ncbi:HpcH/HpaI aldolase/citrate lyase family protein [Halothermothrix orenii]|uniref:Citrate (Pro-3S)-lyase, beta subunit n=1 Tax=Halothermothrix orenii (strain H 168 / OCM 544 / DSM 9562) TaxID=373903 RepID=B8D1Z9_HALOH|nr:CoA ester lyase [Halothermothrix orenii]ACL69226.1 Citrate (pro-3S)-lyase, beta subunit [Halothermothrix orenii H 168]
MKNKLRRSMLYIPANNPGMIQDAFIYGADAILFDLEDSITLTEKDAARYLLCNALQELDFGQAEIVVRINPLNTEYGRNDLEVIVPAKPDAIRVPKVETGEQIKKIDSLLGKLERKAGITRGSIEIMAMIETARGVLNAREIAKASPRITALNLGAEDLTADLGVRRSDEGIELLYARSQIIYAAAENGIDIIDTVYSDVENITGLKEEAIMSKRLGFTGKSVIHPKQIEIVNSVFTPSTEEIKEAEKIVKRALEAEKRGFGVVTVDGKMVDIPVIERAKKLLDRVESIRRASN